MLNFVFGDSFELIEEIDVWLLSRMEEENLMFLTHGIVSSFSTP